MKDNTVVTFTRPPANTFLITGVLALLPAPFIAIAMYLLIDKGVLDRNLLFRERFISAIFVVGLALAMYFILIHFKNFTSYKLTETGLHYRGFLGRKFFPWNDISSAIRSFRKEEYSTTTKSWHGLEIMCITMEDESKCNCSLGALENSDELLKIVNQLSGADSDVIKAYLTEEGHKESYSERTLTRAVLVSSLCLIIGAGAVLYYDALAAGQAGLLAKAQLLLETEGDQEAIETAINDSMKSGVLDDFGIEFAQRLKARFKLNQGFLASSAVILSNTKRNISKRGKKRYFGGVKNLEDILSTMLIAADFSKAKNYEKAVYFLSGESMSRAGGYEKFQLAQVKLMEGDVTEATRILKAAANSNYGWPDARTACKSLLEKLKRGENPIIANPGPTPEEIQSIRTRIIGNNLELIRKLSNIEKQYEPSPNPIVRKLLDSGGTTIYYICSPEGRTTGISIDGSGTSFSDALIVLARDLVGEKYATAVKTLINRGGTEDLFFERMLSQPQWCRIGSSGWKADSARDCLDSLNCPGLESYGDSAINIAITGKKNMIPAITMGFQINRGDSTIAQSDAIGTPGSLGFGTIERPIEPTNGDTWISFSANSFDVEDWIKQHKLGETAEVAHKKIHEALNIHGVEYVSFRPGELKSSMCFRIQQTVKDIDFTKVPHGTKEENEIPEYDPASPPPWQNTPLIHEAVYRMWVRESDSDLEMTVTDPDSKEELKIYPSLPDSNLIYPTSPVTAQVLVHGQTVEGTSVIADVQLIWDSKERNYQGGTGCFKVQPVKLYRSGNESPPYSYEKSGNFWIRR